MSTALDTPHNNTTPNVTSSSLPSRPTIQVTARVMDITEQRTALFHRQEMVIQAFYQKFYTDSPFTPTTLSDNDPLSTITASPASPLFYIANKKPQFAETQKLQTALYLNARDVAQLDEIIGLFDNLHVLDDLVMEIVHEMPPQQPVGWQMTSQGLNVLNVPTVGQIRSPNVARGIEQSAAATVLQFFGVASYTQDKALFIGHIVGYLFCCYYFAHLGVAYGVTPISEEVVKDYPYVTLPVPQLVRLLQELDEMVKAKVYQLAVFCAQISEYALDKRIEKMLITEVNSFNKNDMREVLAQRISYGGLEQPYLFNPVKPLR